MRIEKPDDCKIAFSNRQSIGKLLALTGVAYKIVSSNQSHAQAGPVEIRWATGWISSPDNQAPVLGGAAALLGANNLILNASARNAVEIKINVIGAPSVPYNIKQTASMDTFFVFEDGESVPIPSMNIPWHDDDSDGNGGSYDLDEDLTPSSNGNIFLIDNPGVNNLRNFMNMPLNPFASWNPGEKGVFLFNFTTWVANASTGVQISGNIDWHLKVTFTATEPGWDPTVILPQVGTGHLTSP